MINALIRILMIVMMMMMMMMMMMIMIMMMICGFTDFVAISILALSQYKDVFFSRCGDSHVTTKTVARPSYL